MQAGGLIQWREWGPEAFDEAREGGKLVLLDISAVWCHWCHVMDSTSYSDPELAGIINSRFVPVRVDTDRMPDVNERYNMGGWPTTAVLVPSGEVLAGATYLPPDKLRDTLLKLGGFYEQNRDALDEKIAGIAEDKIREHEEALKGDTGEVSANIVAYVIEELDRNYDEAHGGFGDEPKFPAPDAIDLLLTAYQDTGKAGYLEMAEKTLEGMAGYGMYDHVMGGFFRYSVKRDWSVPHYEKMLEVNAGLLGNFVNAYRINGKAGYLETIKKTASYIGSWLWSEDGYFCASQDADEVYYSLPLVERLKRKPPQVDQAMFTNLNAKAAYAYLTAWETLRDPDYKDKAFRALGFILDKARAADGGLFHYYDGEPHRPGLLTDHSATVKALVYAWQLTDEKKWLDEALAVLKHMEQRFWDAGRGGYFDLSEEAGAAAALAIRAKPMPENSDASQSLKALHVLTGEEKYNEMALRCLRPFARSYREYSFFASGYALSVDYCLKPATELTLAGHRGKNDFQALMDAAGETFTPRRVLRLLDYGKDRAEAARKGLDPEGPATAYICVGTACTARVQDPASLKKELTKAA